MHVEHFDWPFFDDAHRTLARELSSWVATQTVAHDDVDAACRSWVRKLGGAGYLRHCVPAAHGGARDALDSRSLCVARETLAVDLIHGEVEGPTTDAEIEGESVRISLRRADYASPPRA